MATNEEVREFHRRSFEYLGKHPTGIPATALAEQVRTGELDEALFAIGLLQTWLADERTVRVFQARATGKSWGWIGSRLGLSRQSLWERYKDRDDPDPSSE